MVEGWIWLAITFGWIKLFDKIHIKMAKLWIEAMNPVGFAQLISRGFVCLAFGQAIGLALCVLKSVGFAMIASRISGWCGFGRLILASSNCFTFTSIASLNRFGSLPFILSVRSKLISLRSNASRYFNLYLV